MAINAALNSTADAAQGVSEGLNKAGKAAGDFENAIGDADRELRSAQKSVGRYLFTIAQLRSAHDEAKGPIREFRAAAAATLVDDLTGQLQRFKKELENVKRPVDLLTTELDRLNLVAAQRGVMFEAAPKVDELETLIGKLSGVTAAVKSAQDELAVLTGELTAIDLAVEKSLGLGALPKQVDELRTALEALGAERKRQEKAEQLEVTTRQTKSRQQALAESITAQTRTPQEQFQARLKELESVRGRIGESTFARAAQQAMEELKRRLESVKQAVVGGVSLATNTAVSVGSDEGISAIATALRGTAGTNTPEQQSLAINKKMLAALNSIDALLKKKPKIAESPI